MDAWVKILVVLLMMTALSMVMTYLLIDPFIALILMGVILTMLVMTVEPASGKAMAQVIVPIIILLFVLEIFMNPNVDYSSNLWMLVLIGVVLYFMFTIFTGGGTFGGGSFIDAKVALKLFPFYGIAVFLAVLIDPSGKLPIYLMAGTVLCLMAVYFVFLRDYENWPQYVYGTPRKVVAITDLDPRGKVKSGAELWWARAVGEPISAGEEVVVVGLTGFTMLVDKLDSPRLSGPSFETTGQT